jgi:phosphoribosylformimino-5-aminoimidazole carboxamide ribotide isomerase
MRYHFSMLKREGVVIPAIDLLGGSVVRLHQGRYDHVTEFGRDPVELAQRFAAGGAQWLHVIDLDAARTGERRPDHRRVLESIAAVPGLRLQLGGGFRTQADIEWALELGAARVLVGSYAASEPAEVGRIAAASGVVAAAVDCRDGTARTHGWERDSGVPAEQLIDVLVDAGLRDVLVTSIGRDGTGLGVDLNLLQRLRPHVPGALIAAGGVGVVGDITDALQSGIDGVVVGRAMLDGSITLAAALAAARIS